MPSPFGRNQDGEGLLDFNRSHKNSGMRLAVIAREQQFLPGYSAL